MEALAEIKPLHTDFLGANDKLFLERIYKHGLSKYRKQLQAIALNGYSNVLDAGCGFGQWSLALAERNSFVDCCDKASHRIRFVKNLSASLQLKNIRARVCPLENLPYKKDSFDAILCYQALYFTPWRKSIAELARVLKPGGMLYLSFNELGWYMLLWESEKNKAKDYDPKALAARAMQDTLTYDRDGAFRTGANLIIEQTSLMQELVNARFTNIRFNDHIVEQCTAKPATLKPLLPRKYKGLNCVSEVIAQKQ